MLKEKEDFLRKIIIVLDAAIIAAAFLLSFQLRKDFHHFWRLDIFPSLKVVRPISSSMSDYIVVLFSGVIFWLIALRANGMYRSLRTKTPSQIIWIIGRSGFVAALCFSAVVYVLKFESISRTLFFSFIVTAGAFLVAEKLGILYAARFLRSRGYNFRRVLVVGSGSRLRQFVERLQRHPEWGLKIVGIIREGNAEPQDTGGLSVLGGMDDLSRAIRRFCIDEVVFIVSREGLLVIEEALRTCETMGIKAMVTLDLFDPKVARPRQTEFDGMPLMSFETTRQGEFGFFIKRVTDIVLSALAIAILSPVMLAAAALIKLTSDGPVFFLQKRVGLNGRKFVLYKFRTMRNGAHRKQKELAGLNIMQGPVFKVAYDPRVTPVGRILRKFSIDELPQLFNVFLGQMSLVGPRPPVSREVKQYDLWQRRRLSVPPGITCLWQVSGRNRIVDFNEWMNLDLQYIDKWSFWLDLKVLLKTVPAVLSGRGAC